MSPHNSLSLFSLTFVEEVVAAVLNSFLAIIGDNEAGEGREPHSEEDREFDHFGSVLAFVFVWEDLMFD